MRLVVLISIGKTSFWSSSTCTFQSHVLSREFASTLTDVVEGSYKGVGRKGAVS